MTRQSLSPRQEITNGTNVILPFSNHFCYREVIESPTWNDAPSSICPTAHSFAPSSSSFPQLTTSVICEYRWHRGATAEASPRCENQVERIRVLDDEKTGSSMNEHMKNRWQKLLLRLGFVVAVNKIRGRLQASLGAILVSDRAVPKMEQDKVSGTRHPPYCLATNLRSVNEIRKVEGYECSSMMGTRPKESCKALVATDSNNNFADQFDECHSSPLHGGHSPQSATTGVTLRAFLSSYSTSSRSNHIFSEKYAETVTLDGYSGSPSHLQRQGNASVDATETGLCTQPSDHDYDCESSSRNGNINMRSKFGISDLGGFSGNSSVYSSSNNSADFSLISADAVTRNKSVEYGTLKRSKTHLKKCRSAQDAHSTRDDDDADSGRDAVVLPSSTSTHLHVKNVPVAVIENNTIVEAGTPSLKDCNSSTSARRLITGNVANQAYGDGHYPEHVTLLSAADRTTDRHRQVKRFGSEICYTSDSNLTSVSQKLESCVLVDAADVDSTDCMKQPGKAARMKKPRMHIHSDVMREINEEINREMNHEIERELTKERRESLKQMTCKMCKFVDEEMFEPGKQEVYDHVAHIQPESPIEVVQGRTKMAVMARRSVLKGAHRVRSLPLPEPGLHPSPFATARCRIQDPGTHVTEECRAKATRRSRALHEKPSSITRCRNTTGSVRPSCDSLSYRQTDKAGKTDIKRQALPLSPGPMLAPLQCPSPKGDAVKSKIKPAPLNKRMTGTQTPSPLQSPLASRQGSRRIAPATSPLASLSAAATEPGKSCIRADSGNGTGSCVYTGSETKKVRGTDVRLTTRKKNTGLVSPSHRLPKIEKNKSHDARILGKVTEIDREHGSEGGSDRSVGSLSGSEVFNASSVPKTHLNDISKVDGIWIDSVEGSVGESELPRSVLLAALKAGLPSRLWSMIPAIATSVKDETDFGISQHRRTGTYATANGVDTCVGSSYDTTPKTSRLPTPRSSPGALGKTRSDINSAGRTRGGAVAVVGIKNIEGTDIQRMKDEEMVRHFLEVSEDHLT